MSLISLQNIEASFGAEDVLLGVGGEVNFKDRIGLVGRNGAGKTTLLHILAGRLKPSAGAMHVARGTSLAFVDQVQDETRLSGSVYTQALAPFEHLIAMEERLEEAAAALSDGASGADAAYAELLTAFEDAGGYEFRNRIAQVLHGLGFPTEDWSQPVTVLSGGQRTRLALATALLAQPDVLVLDEPTNHIDLDAMTWLDDFLARWEKTLIVVSHDRYFLDRVANRIWLLEDGRVRSYRGNYTAFETQRAAELDLLRRQAEAQAEVIAKEEAFIRRYRAGQRAREAKGRATRLARVERLKAPVAQRTTRFGLSASRSGELVLRTTDLVAGYEAPGLVDIGSLEVIRGERIALIGPNGAGKTTLLKTLNRALTPITGRLETGSNVRVSHYWQEAENLDPDRSVLEEVGYGAGITTQAARDLLGRFLFRGGEVNKPVSALSGGERSRLALAKLVLEEANLLLLDEPTNHLDIPSRESLETALTGYEGSVVFVSHDRQLIAGLATRLWIVEGSRLVVFDGTYAEYLEAKRLARAPVEPAPSRAPARPQPTLSRRQQERIAGIETEIEDAEHAIEALGVLINDASARGDLTAIADLARQLDAAQQRHDALMARYSLELA